MAYKGWEDVTAADIAQRNATVTYVKHVKSTMKGVIDIPVAAVPRKGHKFKAEACLVTDDLTMFAASQIAQLAAERHGLSERKQPLKNLAATVDIHGRHFPSLKEGRRFVELARLEKSGAITYLQMQVAYPLCVQPIARPVQVIGEYRLDFQYERDGRLCYEDAKGVRTQLYAWKKKHVEAQYGITISEI